MQKSHLKLVSPTEVNRTVAPTRRPNAELRTPPFADRLDQGVFDWRATYDVAERIMKCNHDPPLLSHEIWTTTEPCECQAIPHCLGLRLLRSRFRRRQHRLLIAAANGGRDRRDESCRRRLAYWVRVA
jgi:hypothetical protein